MAEAANLIVGTVRTFLGGGVEDMRFSTLKASCSFACVSGRINLSNAVHTLLALSWIGYQLTAQLECFQHE